MASKLSLFTLALGAAVLVTAPVKAVESVNPVCTLSAAALDAPLTRTRSRLQHGGPLTIVAIGSSSTAGAGATSAAASYPSRLEVFLKERFRGLPIRVINKGVNGEEEGDMLARFERDVIAEKPDLVLWQLGANAVMRDRPLALEKILIDSGIKRLKAAGVDVVLIDVQYTAATIAKAGALPMVGLIGAQAQAHRVGVFRRFEMMKGWREGHQLPFDAFSIADGLHLNDWGYNCFARNLAATIIDAAAPPAMAMAPAGTVVPR